MKNNTKFILSPKDHANTGFGLDFPYVTVPKLHIFTYLNVVWGFIFLFMFARPTAAAHNIDIVLAYIYPDEGQIKGKT